MIKLNIDKYIDVLPGKLKKIKFNLLNVLSLKNLKIRNKLLIMILLTGLIPFAIMSFISINKASNEIQNEILKGNELFYTLTKDRINEFFDSREINARVLAASDNIVKSIEIFNSYNYSKDEEKEISDKLYDYLFVPLNEHNYTDVVLTNMYGEVVFSMNYKKIDIAPVIFYGDYTSKTMKGLQNWSQIFRNTFIDDNIIVLSTPIYSIADDLNPIGTLNIIFNQSNINSIVQNGIEKLGDNTDVYLVNEEGLLLTNTMNEPYKQDAALNKFMNTLAVDHLSKQILDENTYYYESLKYKGYIGHNVISSLSVVKIGDSYSGLIIEASEKESYSKVFELRNVLISLAIVIIIISTIIALRMSQTISKPLKHITEVTNNIASYNLNFEVNQNLAKRKDEIGNLERAIIRIIINLKSIISDVNKSSSTVIKSSDYLRENSSSSAKSSEEVANSIAKIAEGSSEQSQGAVYTFNKTKELNDIIMKDFTVMSEMELSTREICSLIEEGVDITSNLIQITEKSSKANIKVHDSVVKSFNSSQRISDASKFIVNVANKTNMLALNATLEAARAGEYGRGFNVVANEIKILADQSSESAEVIGDIINELFKDNSNVMETMQSLLEISSRQTDSAVLTDMKFKDIKKAIEQFKSKVDSLNTSRIKINDLKIEVEKAIEKLTLIAKENYMNTEEVSAAVQQQAAVLEELSTLAKNLDISANELNQTINKFTV